MRVFAEEEKNITNKILHGEGYARNLINIIDSMNTLQGVRIQIDRLNKTAYFLFETQEKEPTEQEITWGIKRHKELIELIITHVTFLRYLDLQELAVFFDPTTNSEDEVIFGMGATNRPFYGMEIEDKTIVSLLIKYIHKEIKPSPLLVQLVNNNYLTDEEIKFKKQYFATWSAVAVSVALGIFGIYNNIQNSISQEEQFKTQLLENKKLITLISTSIKENKTSPINYTSEIKEISSTLFNISNNASLESNKHVVEVKLMPQDNIKQKYNKSNSHGTN